jgi:hypothetical protein
LSRGSLGFGPADGHEGLCNPIHGLPFRAKGGQDPGGLGVGGLRAACGNGHGGRPGERRLDIVGQHGHGDAARGHRIQSYQFQQR